MPAQSHSSEYCPDGDKASASQSISSLLGLEPKINLPFANHISSIGKSKMVCHVAPSLAEVPSELRELVHEYASIFQKECPTELQWSRFHQIIDQSCENPRLHFWLSEFEHILGHELGYLSDELSERYENQKAKHRECFGDVDTDFYDVHIDDTFRVCC